MPISPQDIRAQQFRTVKRGGYDQREVEAFRTAAAEALEQANQAATAMEARARAAVARIQELQQAAPSDEQAAPPVAAEPAAAVSEPGVVGAEDAATISRTLLLAQRTADVTVAEAENEAERILETARAESRKAGEAERVLVEGEVQALLARRDFLESDVDQLEQFLDSQRQRISEVATELGGITSRIANGLAPMRRPQLSASDADHGDEVAATPDAPAPAPDDDAADAVPEDDTGGVDVGTLIDQAQESDVGEYDRDRQANDDPTPDERHTLFTADDQR
jgi:DivIVA domain-containing protein